MAQSQGWQWIPTHLTLEQFENFVLPHLHTGSRGPQPKLALHAITGVEGSVATPSAPQIPCKTNFFITRLLLSFPCGNSHELPGIDDRTGVTQ